MQNTKKKIHVGILMGGISLEREVSFNSGRTICDHLDQSMYIIIPLFQAKNRKLYKLPWHFLHRGKISDFENRLEQEGECIQWNYLKNIIDILYSALHGSYGEDGHIQGICELFNIPYTGSSILSSALASDKFFHDTILQRNGIVTPRGYLIKHYQLKEDIKNIVKKEYFPCIVKPNEEGSSIGISIVNDYDSLFDAITKAQTVNEYRKQSAYVQELIQGKEFSCILIQKSGEWLAFEPTEIVHKKEEYVFDYNDKYLPGAGIKFTPARFSIEVRQLIKNKCIEVARALNAKIILRVDGFVKNDETIVILESNIFPGTAPSSFTFVQAAYNNMSHADFINSIIYESLSEENKKMIDELKKDNNTMIEKKINIAVVLGGSSNEKEVSLDSGRNIVYKLRKDKYHVTPLFLNKDHDLYYLSLAQLVKDSTHEIELSLSQDQRILWDELPQLYDFVFLGLHGGVGENGSVQAMLEMLNIPYSGSSVTASAICMNKYITLEILKYNNIGVTNYIFIEKMNISFDYIQQKISSLNMQYPLIIKPHDDGCSVMLSVAHNFNEVVSAIELIFSNSKNACLIEEFIDGMELTIGVLGNDNIIVLPPSYTPKKNHFLSLEEKFLPGEGQNITPAPLAKKYIDYIQSEIKKAYQVLGCSGYVRFDCFFIEKTEKLIILECNSLPAMTPATVLFHQAAELGMKPSDLCDVIIQLGIEKHNKI
jgi:UDP-N-acetylmuramate--alanine ligase